MSLAVATLVVLGAAPATALVPAGQYRPFFIEARPDGGYLPPPPVEVPAFRLDVRPVTVGEFLAFVRAQPEWRKGRVARVFADLGYLATWPDDLTPPEGSAKWPVTEVSWFAANAYCRSMRARLPTVAQWEHAAEEEGAALEAVNAQILSWYAEPSRGVRREAGSGAPRRHGLRDLHGLIWEWVLDFNEALVGGDVRDANGKEVKLFCGGGAGTARDPANYAAYMRFAFRSSLGANYTVRNLGFRCARST